MVKEERQIKKCKTCGSEYSVNELKRRKYICGSCGSYFRIPARQRIQMIADKDTFEEWFNDIETRNVLGTEGYEEKLKEARSETGMDEAIIVGSMDVFGQKLAIGVCESEFLMGSMGYVVGEKVTKLVERATEERLPVFIFCCSGGARMQEGMVSLMQMEKTSAAIKRHSKAGLFYCPILTDPTTGGVTASFAMLGDVNLAEPGALIGFAGQRVIRQTIGEELPEGFQLAEFQEEHGFIDGIVERKRIRQVMLFLAISNSGGKDRVIASDKEVLSLGTLARENATRLIRKRKSAWDKVREIRKSDYPSASEFLSDIFDIFVELKGDRYYKNDPSVVGGIALFEGRPVTVISQNRGKNLNEAMECHFGMPMPEGYRKAIRLMHQAEKFNRPIISFINTPGAYCGVDAERRGQGEAIARNLFEMSDLTVPVLAIILGEAGSGGALALAVGNEVWMLENATYSILTPEGYAAILWKDASRADEAAEKMKITAQDLKRLGIIDKVIPSFGKSAKDGLSEVSSFLKQNIRVFLNKMDKMSPDEIRNDRYNRFRKM